MAEEKKKPKANVSKKKVKAVEKLAEDMKNAATIMLVSIRNLPSPQLQKIKKDLRGKATVQIAKKSIIERAIDLTSIEEMKALKEHLEADVAVALSKDDAFELAAWLFKNRNPIAAKIGQEATEDIKVEAGPTDLPPGPDISALSGVGLQVSVEEGKIAIKEPAVIVKAGETVSTDVASVLLKLDIKPFMIGLNPSVIYDSKAKKIYVGVKIDKDEALNNLLVAQSKGLGLAQKLQIVTKDTIGYLLAKANAEMEKLKSLAPVASPDVPPVEGKEEKKEEAVDVPSEEGKEEKPAEESKEETRDKSEEESKS